MSTPHVDPATVAKLVDQAYEADCARVGVCPDWRAGENTSQIPGGVLYCDRPHGHVGMHVAVHPLPYMGDTTWVW